MRQIVLDTETTGFNAEGDDRLVEVGALEIVNYVPTGKFFHKYINPQREVSEGAVAVHGLTFEKLQNEPLFAEIYDEMMDFIGDSPLVIHNAEFDMRFLRAEAKRMGMPPLPFDRAIDTLAIARKKFPGAPNSLDALCKRFGVDNSSRTYHGALLDSQLLAEVYLELIGGAQPDLILEKKGSGSHAGSGPQQSGGAAVAAKNWPARDFPVSRPEEEAHWDMLKSIKDALWMKSSN
jgi:DNA polymerase-3 subunit epsilon